MDREHLVLQIILAYQEAEAKEIIDNYKKQFPGIQKYMDDTINFAREHGYVQTLMGRKRWLRDINSSNFTVRVLQNEMRSTLPYRELLLI